MREGAQGDRRAALKYARGNAEREDDLLSEDGARNLGFGKKKLDEENLIVRVIKLTCLQV